MDKNSRIVTIPVGILIFYVAYQFWFGSGIFNGFFASDVETGKLGAGTADAFSQGLEILAVILSTVGGVAISISTKLVSWIGTTIEQWRTVPKPVVIDGEPINIPVSTMPPQQMQELQRLLIQAVLDRDKPLTVALANKLAGTKFLVFTKSQNGQDEFGFPTTDGAK